jgi:predicted MFS family arabinose efflux permease
MRRWFQGTQLVMSRRTSIFVLSIGALSTILTFGIRQTFGLFLPPLHADLGWSVAALSFAWAVQNLLWGAFQPIAGAIADSKGPTWVAFFGGVAYVAGIWLMSEAHSPLSYGIGNGLLVGIGLACSGMSVVLAAIMRASPPEKRGLYGGIVTAGGSVGQLIFMPATQAMIARLNWQPTLQILTLVSIAIALCAFAFPREHKQAAATADVAGATSIGDALRTALADRSYLLLISGFFVCGFHLAFIGFHLPQFAALCGLSPTAASDSLALVGGFNAVGCVAIGVMMRRMQSKYLLSAIYFLRAAAIAAFFLLPVTEFSIRAFGAAMGLLWLSTVPPTSGLVARLFGTRYLTMLFGIAFFSHQVGGFIGGYWAGWLFDTRGNYDAVWWVSIVLGILSGIVHLPIRERAPVPAMA